MERPKVLKVQARKHSTFTKLEDGTWRVDFPVLALATVGATEEEAWQAMRVAIMELVQADEDAQETWEAFAEIHHVVEGTPES